MDVTLNPFDLGNNKVFSIGAALWPKLTFFSSSSKSNKSGLHILNPTNQSTTRAANVATDFFFLLRHIVFTHTHAHSLPALQCCTVDTTLKLQHSLSLRGMMKTNTPPEDTVKYGTERTKNKPK